MPDGDLLLIAVLGSTCFASFTWGTLRHFVRRANGPAGTWAISLLSLTGFGLFVWRTFSRPVAQTWGIGCGFFVASLLLWASAIRVSRASPPTLAFTGDEPTFLLDSGPYRLTRHPFYGAYMLFWVGTGLTTQDFTVWTIVAVLGSIYWVAAAKEEEKFARSAFASNYGVYAERTGTLFPLFRRHSPKSAPKN